VHFKCLQYSHAGHVRPCYRPAVCIHAFALPSDVKHATTTAQLAIMRELRVCLNVDGAEAVPADVVWSCPRKNVEVLVGASRAREIEMDFDYITCQEADPKGALADTQELRLQLNQVDVHMADVSETGDAAR